MRTVSTTKGDVLVNRDDVLWTVYEMATAGSPELDTKTGHMKNDGCKSEIRS